MKRSTSTSSKPSFSLSPASGLSFTPNTISGKPNRIEPGESGDFADQLVAWNIRYGQRPGNLQQQETFPVVMAGLVPAIPTVEHPGHPNRDRLDKPGDDGRFTAGIEKRSARCVGCGVP